MPQLRLGMPSRKQIDVGEHFVSREQDPEDSDYGILLPPTWGGLQLNLVSLVVGSKAHWVSPVEIATKKFDKPACLREQYEQSRARERLPFVRSARRLRKNPVEVGSWTNQTPQDCGCLTILSLVRVYVRKREAKHVDV